MKKQESKDKGRRNLRGSTSADLMIGRRGGAIKIPFV